MCAYVYVLGVCIYLRASDSELVACACAIARSWHSSFVNN